MHEQDNSDEDDGQGVYLDPANFMSRSTQGGQAGFTGDELYFTGYDLGQARDGRGSGNGSYEDIVYGEYGYSEEEERAYYEEQRYAAYRAAWDRETALLQSADEKLRKASKKGKNSVSLSQDEVDAMERRKQQQRDSPGPSTPKKGKGSRSNSVVSLTGDKSRKKSSSTRLFGTSSPSVPKTRTPKSTRKSSNEQQGAPYASNNPPPAFMVAGPDGVPLYAPVGYYPSLDNIRSSPSASRPGSRSVSASSRRQVTPPYENNYPPYPSRFHGPPSDLRPPSSSSSSRPPSDDALRVPRNRSASTVPYPQDLFGAPAVPAVQSRRNVSGPPDISYAKLRRVPPSSPLAAREASTNTGQEWPPRTDSRRSRGSSSSSTDDDGEGVRVEIVPEGDGDGYRIDRKPVGEGAGSGNSGARRRKGRK
ncbi:hypothetical protein MBLNU459_g0332t1 [Dothideomycetes sp. NU459]